MDTIRICKQCQKPLPQNAPEGLCPECLARVALGSEPAVPGTRVPPAPAALAAQFPQLEILELLGMGGMGMVYKARQPRLDRVVALKILPIASMPDASFGERFEREAKALAKLNHPGIVAVYDFGQIKEYYYFIMEFVDGMNLRQLIHSKTLEPRQALELVTQICTALQFAHDEKIVHRDIKPENILITKKGQVKIADFGLAKLLGSQPDTALTASQMVMGTMNYMAPEQRENTKDVDHRADIYSLGVVFYEMLTGEVPMGRFDAPSKKVQIDVRLDEVVLHALEREPARRYQHVSEVKSNVETITSTMSQEKKAPSVPEVTKPKLPSRFPWILLKPFAIFAVAWLGIGLCLRWAIGDPWFAIEPHDVLPTPFLTGLLKFAYWLFNPGYAWLLLPQAYVFILGAQAMPASKFGLARRQLPPLIRRQLDLRLIGIGGGYVVVALATIFLFWFNHLPFSLDYQKREQLLMILLTFEIVIYQNLVSRANNCFYYAATNEIFAKRWTPPKVAPPFPTAIKILVGLFVVSLLSVLSAGWPGLRGEKNLDYAVLVGNVTSMLIVSVSLAMTLIFTLRLHSRRRIEQAREKGLWPPLGEVPMLDHVKGLVQAGDLFLAVKLYRQIHPVPWLDAKVTVEKLAASFPAAATPPPAASSRKKTVIFWLCAYGVFCLGWLVTKMLWNFRGPGCWLACFMMTALVMWVSWITVKRLRLFPAEFSLKKAMPKYLLGLITIFLALTLGFVCLIGGFFNFWEENPLHGNFYAKSPEQFVAANKGVEYKLIRNLDVFSNDIPNVELGVYQTIGHQVGVTDMWFPFPPWKWSGPPGKDHFGTIDFLVMGCFLLIWGSFCLICGWRGPGTKPFRAPWRNVMASLAVSACVLGSVLPIYVVSLSNGYSLQSGQFFSKTKKSTVADTIQKWAVRNGYAMGDEFEWDINTVPKGKCVAKVSTREAWKPSPFDRWQSTWTSFRGVSRYLTFELVSSENPDQTIIYVYSGIGTIPEDLFQFLTNNKL